MPRINISLSDRDRTRLERLAGMRGGNMSRAVSEAVIHTLASVELGEGVHYVIPSEQQDIDAGNESGK